MKLQTIASISLLVLVTGVSARANLYTQTPCALADCFGSGLFASALPGQQEVADPFTPDSNWRVDSVNFRGWYFPSSPTPPTPAIFDIRIFADNGGLPADTPFFSQTVNILPTFAETFTLVGGEVRTAFDFVAPINPAFLAANIQVWLSIGMNQIGVGDFVWMNVEDPNAKPGTYAFRSPFNPSFGDWFVSPTGVHDANYTLVGEANVPEPASIVIFGAGLLVLGLLRRRA